MLNHEVWAASVRYVKKTDGSFTRLFMRYAKSNNYLIDYKGKKGIHRAAPIIGVQLIMSNPSIRRQKASISAGFVNLFDTFDMRSTIQQARHAVKAAIPDHSDHI